MSDSSTSMSDESKLLEKLERIEALFAQPGTAGERLAAEAAMARVRARLEEASRSAPPVEMQFSMRNPWSKRLFIALLRRYGLKPFRYHRQRRTTVMVHVSRRFVDETLWPEFIALNDALTTHLDEITQRVIARAIHGDQSEVDVLDERRMLTTSEDTPRS